MRTVLLNVYENTVTEVDVKDDLDAFYEKLGCDLIEIDERRIGGKWFDVMCDEEGTFRDDARISAIDNFGNTMFVGNLMFFHNDGEGNLTGITEDEVKHLKRLIQTMYTRKHPEGYKMLTQCEYR